MKRADWIARISVEEAAERMEVDLETLRRALRRERLPASFGFYVKEENANKGSYVIPRERFEAYMRGDDLARDMLDFAALAERIADALEKRIAGKIADVVKTTTERAGSTGFTAVGKSRTGR